MSIPVLQTHDMSALQWTKKGVLAFFVTAAVLLSPVAFAAKASGRVEVLCNLLLTSSGVFKKDAPAGSSVGLSQAKRLKAFFDGLNTAQKTDLFAELSHVNFEQIRTGLATGKNLGDLNAKLAKNEELAAALTDVIDFGLHFPGIFALSNAQVMVDQILGVVVSEEAADKVVGNADLLASQSMTSRLIITINTTLINLIQQMEAERIGIRFQRTMLQHILNKIRLFIFPAYSRVKNLTETGQEYQMQLNRLRLVDRIVIYKGLSESAALGLTKEELAQMTYLVLNSPAEISEIEKDLQGIFGPTFAIGRPVEIGQFKLFDANREAKQIDFGNLWESFDRQNLLSLDTMNKLINAARARKSELLRTIKDFDKQELQLRHEAANRRVYHYRRKYWGFTEQTSNESYTVERRHTRTVEDGKDEDGKMTYREETYYVDDQVHPSFENILSDSYDRGDRDVSGLESIRQRANMMVEREAPARALMSEVAGYVEVVERQYTQLVLKGNSRAAIKEAGERLKPRLIQAIKDQKAYVDFSDNDISRQYGRDDIKNFRGRNGWMFERLKNALAFVELTIEAEARGLQELAPNYDLMDFTGWLRGLRNIRNRNYAIKTGVTLATAFTASYFASPEMQMLVQDYTGVSYKDVMGTLSSLSLSTPQFDESMPQFRRIPQ